MFLFLDFIFEMPYVDDGKEESRKQEWNDRSQGLYIHSCLVPQFLQNLEFILSLEPQAKQNLVSDSDVLLAESFFGGVTSLLESEDGIPRYISVTAPEGLKVSSVSGIKSESSFLMLPLLVFS